MTLRLHNTLTGRLEEFAPEKPPEVRMYVCGPTVYNRAHLGNFRSFVATDVLRRALQYKGWRVKEVMNVTDVDDRIIQQALAASQDIATFTAALDPGLPRGHGDPAHADPRGRSPEPPNTSRR